MPIKVLHEDELSITYEISIPNDACPQEAKDWSEEEWQEWRDKIKKLEKEGVRGQMVISEVKFDKNPFLNGGITIRRPQIKTGSNTSGTDK